MIAAVLCGGMGTRLRQVIGDHQKCAVEVGGRPWIHRILDQIQAVKDIERVICLTGYLAEEVDEAVKTWKARKSPTERIPEVSCLVSKPLGAEEAIQLAFKKTPFAPWLLVMNGDTLVEGFPLTGFVEACCMAKRTVTVYGPSLLPPHTHAESGISFRAPGTRPSTYPTKFPFLDIGTPEGLAEARKRYL